MKSRANIVFMGGLLLGMPPQRCTGGGGGGSGGAAGTAGTAGEAGTGGSSAGTGGGGTDTGGTAGTDTGGTAGTDTGGSETSAGTGGLGGSSGSGGSGGSAPGGSSGSAGTSGAGPVECPSGAFALVGKAGCFECPGYIYEQGATSCATLASDSAQHHYDAASRQLRLRAGDGLPLPQPGWTFRDVSTTFDTPAHQGACTAQPVYSVDGFDYVVDLSQYGSCEGLSDLVLFDLSPNYGCASSLSNSTYVGLHFEAGAASLSFECASPNPLPPIAFGSLVSFPQPPRYDVSTPSAVKDNQTGLVWEQLADGSYPSLTQADAVAYCSDLDHAGFDDGT